MSYENPYKFIPINPNLSLDKVKTELNKIYVRYYPKTLVTEDKFSKEKNDKYEEFTLTLNEIRRDLRKGYLKYGEDKYNSYKNYFKPIVDEYSEEKLKIILKENDLDTSGNIKKLRKDVIDKVPCEVAKINLWEFEARNKQNKNKFNQLKVDKIKKICQMRGLKTTGTKNDLILRILIDVDEDEIDIIISNIDEEAKIKLKLEGLEEYKLKRILELKSEKIYKNKRDLINKIVSTININEIENLIEKVNDEYKTYESKLKTINLQQLKLILSNENLNALGNQDTVIKSIFENISLDDIDKKITEIDLLKDKALEKFYGIIGKTKLKNDFILTLNEYGIKESQFKEIKTEMVNSINNYQISENEVKEELNKRLEKKSEEIEKNTLNELYKIVGKTTLNPDFLNRLKDLNLDETVGEEIRKELEEDIKSKKISLDELESALEIKIKEAELKDENEKFSLLYKYIGENEINSIFKKRLEKNNLDEDFWLKIKNEMTSLIKEKAIEKDSIKTKIDELLNAQVVNNLLLEEDLPTLNQLVILENFEKADNKDQQIEIIKSNLSERFNKTTIKNNIIKINEVNESLNQLYQIQIAYILEKNGLDKNGEKDELINRILSNLNIELVKLYISQHKKIKEELNETQLSYLAFLKKENNIEVKGIKTKVINEIIKNVNLEKIKKDLVLIDEYYSKLNQLQENELMFIAETNDLSINKDDSLIDQIILNVDLNSIDTSVNRIENVKEIVHNFNEIQRKHLLIISNEDVPESKEEQVNSILLNTNLNEIEDLDKRIKNIGEELNSLNIEQLNDILKNNHMNPIYSKEHQINYILDNLLIEEIENNIHIMKEMKNGLRELNDSQIRKILKINNIEVSDDRDTNISKIFYEVPSKILNNNIIYVKNEDAEENILDEIKDSILYSPRREEDKKYSLTSVRKDNLNLIPVFENKKTLKDFIKNKFYGNTINIKAIKKEFNFFKELILNQNNIDGLIVFRDHTIEIIEKEYL